MNLLNQVPIHLVIEGVSAEFKATGWHFPAEDGQREEFDVRHLYYVNSNDERKDWISLMDWPSVNDEVIKQLKAVEQDGNL